MYRRDRQRAISQIKRTLLAIRRLPAGCARRYRRARSVVGEIAAAVDEAPRLHERPDGDVERSIRGVRQGVTALEQGKEPRLDLGVSPLDSLTR
jgi:hypothetical protein